MSDFTSILQCFLPEQPLHWYKQAAKPRLLHAEFGNWGGLYNMAKQTRHSKRKTTTSQPEKFLLGLRKKLGVRTLLEVKRQALHKALAATKGDKALAAALLGIGKTTLYRSLAE